MTVTWNYTDHNGQAQVATASLPFTATDFVPVPILGVYKSSDHTQQVLPSSPPNWGLTQGTTYYLFDDELVPGGNPSHPGAAFYLSSDSNPSISSGDTQIAGSPAVPPNGNGPITFAASALCSSGCYFKIEVPATAGTVRAFKYTVSSNNGGGGCHPPDPGCNGGGGPPTASVVLAAPTPVAPHVGDTVTFTAAPVNFVGTPTLPVGLRRFDDSRLRFRRLGWCPAAPVAPAARVAIARRSSRPAARP